MPSEQMTLEQYEVATPMERLRSLREACDSFYVDTPNMAVCPYSDYRAFIRRDLARFRKTLLKGAVEAMPLIGVVTTLKRLKKAWR